jgi:hypothetical protein
MRHEDEDRETQIARRAVVLGVRCAAQLCGFDVSLSADVMNLIVRIALGQATTIEPGADVAESNYGGDLDEADRRTTFLIQQERLIAKIVAGRLAD